MVCEREPDSPNDPAEGRIELIRDGEWLTANGTTLGADDGVAIAAMMALVEDEYAPHGPLQLLMTVAEEVGLEGANGLDGSLAQRHDPGQPRQRGGRRLTVGCAGSTDTWVRMTEPRAPLDDGAVALAVKAEGGLGGHSGMQHPARPRQRRSRCSAARCARPRAGAVRLVSLEGGKSRNAIPRDAVAVCAVAGDDEHGLRERARDGGGDDPRRVRRDGPRRAPSRSSGTDAAGCLVGGRDHALLDAVALVPTGPLAMSPDFDGLVETSTSLGEAITEGDTLTLHSLSRSSNDSAHARGDRRRWRLPRASPAAPSRSSTTTAAGGRISTRRRSRRRRRVYERLFGEQPIVTRGPRRPRDRRRSATRSRGLDMISFGPQIESPHSPDERVSIPTVERFWRLLVGVRRRPVRAGGDRR